jgi:protein-S-isoprenylcysteine O-methyltransferase Ste14
MNRLFWRALLAFLALPGVVAFAVPLGLLAPRDMPFDPRALALVVPGLILLFWCVRSFSINGRGTLAPWAPPEALVITGPYRFSRNPMYIAVALLLWGWAAGWWSRGLAVYAIGVMAAFHLRVVLGEEPWLAKRHGESWRRYAADVPRWLGRRHRSP